MASSLSALQLFFILCAGILPPLVWLWFWLKEDTRRPEPRKLLVLSFFAGALSVLFVVPFQAAAQYIFSPNLVLLLVWATIEEVTKYAVAFLIDFRKKAYDEPIDAMIYLITVALGFAAFENVLFLIKSMVAGGLSVGIMTAGMRFLGASLLHVFSSATLGGIIALAYCKSKRERIVSVLIGIMVASALHTLFNFFIMNESLSDGSGNVLAVFAVLWVGVMCLLLFFEKVKTITCKLS